MLPNRKLVSQKTGRPVFHMDDSSLVKMQEMWSKGHWPKTDKTPPRLGGQNGRYRRDLRSGLENDGDEFGRQVS